MKHILITTAASLLLALSATAQTMPQDNWRFDPAQFSSPVNTNQLRSIAVGSGGVYVGEIFSGSTPNRVLRFTEAGVFVSRFADTFGYILGVACDPAGNVYLLDRTDSRVKMYDSTGTFIRQWGGAGTGDGQFSLATATGNTMIAVSKTSEIYVCDPGNTRVQVFNSSGTFLRKWGQLGSLPGQFLAANPTGIAISADGVQAAAAEIAPSGPSVTFKVFDPNGAYQKQLALGYHNTPSLAISQDNLLATGINYFVPNNWWNWALRVYDLAGLALVRDYSIGQNNGNGVPLNFGVAFSAKGNIYAVKGTTFSIVFREYSNASNFLAPPAIPHPLVLSAAQRAGTNLVDVDYQVTDADSATVTTALLAVRSGDDNRRIGNSMAMRTFVEGTATNIGANQPTGVTRHVTWNMPADWAVDYATIQIEALAKDNRNMLGIHWITVPASGGEPAIQVSSAPVTDTMLHDLYLWLMGSGQGVSVAYAYNSGNPGGWMGTANGSGGVYAGGKLAEDYIYTNGYDTTYVSFRTLSAGRLYAAEQMGAHPITNSEKARALAGTFGFTSVDDNTLVKTITPATSYLKGWGDNTAGQANWVAINVPNISKISASGSTTLYITSDGTLWGMGNNASGQLGDGTTNNRVKPIKIATGVSQCAVGGVHCVFVKADGTLWAMGGNTSGQLGDGTTTNRLTPVQVATSVSSVACGTSSSEFIKTDGTLWAMGGNTYGQLGDGTTTNRNSPVQIASAVAQCTAGVVHSMFVKTDGTLWAMGWNGQGALGDGTTTNRVSPVQIATGVSQASAGGDGSNGYHSLFVKSNNTLWAMGFNAQGQLGDGTTTQRVTPVQVATAVVQAATGALHSVFRKSDNTVWTMGYNASGQLGDGTTTNRSTPIQLDTNALGIAAGASHTVTFTIP